MLHNTISASWYFDEFSGQLYVSVGIFHLLECKGTSVVFEVAVSMQIISLLTCVSNVYIEHAKSIKYADLFRYEGIVRV